MHLDNVLYFLATILLTAAAAWQLHEMYPEQGYSLPLAASGFLLFVFRWALLRMALLQGKRAMKEFDQRANKMRRGF